MAATDVHFVRKTSQSHPLRADVVVYGQGSGWLAITFIPGKKGRGRTTTVWDREISTDLEQLKEAGATGLVSLVDVSELEAVHAKELPERAEPAGLTYIDFAMSEDAELPSMDKMDKLITDLAKRVEGGERIVVFSNHGWGRAGVIGACVMLRLKRNMTANDAIQRVRSARSVWCIVRDNHVKFVQAYAERVRGEFGSPVSTATSKTGDESPRAAADVSTTPGGPKSKGKSFLLGFDGSKFGQLAFDTVVSLMRPEMDTLFLATVHEKSSRVDRVPTMDKPVTRLDYHMKYCEDHKLTVYPIDIETTTSVGEELCKLARINEVDLIVVGTRGQSNLEKMIMGSTSRYVTDNAPCSVLIVR